MAKAKKTEAVAPETAQEETQDIQAQESTSECAQETAQAAQGEQPAAAQGKRSEAVQETSFGGAERTSRQPEAAQDLAELSEGLMTGYAVTGCDALNLREGPSLDARIITVLPCGAGVVGDGEPGPEGWLHVRTERLEGWMLSKHLEPLPLQELGYGAE